MEPGPNEVGQREEVGASLELKMHAMTELAQRFSVLGGDASGKLDQFADRLREIRRKSGEVNPAEVVAITEVIEGLRSVLDSVEKRAADALGTADERLGAMEGKLGIQPVFDEA